MIISVTQAEYLGDYRLRLHFNDGANGEVDLQDLVFKYPAAEPLRDKSRFQQFSLDEWSTVVWDCGFDVSPETLYERAMGKNITWLEIINDINTSLAQLASGERLPLSDTLQSVRQSYE
ncbi:DUF2442 domain-containing protein [Methylomonas koyamae]|uniref:DUF2442 domain-containing protein n=1 Tax=Methylomonas koyamae TaxID=702114 RepID=UPI000BC31EDC|nr:DUF2442 domain-containing protein [Methylomonas koyamae]ATG88752.1 hypothetical protein MKLM6_0473 [Methylomonas koyamae]